MKTGGTSATNLQIVPPILFTDTLLPPVGPCPIRAHGWTACRTRPTRAVHSRTRDSHRIRTSARSRDVRFRLSYAVSGVQNARYQERHRHPLTSGRRIGISGRRPSFPLMVRASHTGCEQSRPRPSLNRTSGPCAAAVVLDGGAALIQRRPSPSPPVYRVIHHSRLSYLKNNRNRRSATLPRTTNIQGLSSSSVS